MQEAAQLQTQLQNTQHAVSEKEVSLLEAEAKLEKLCSINKELVDYMQRLGQDLNFANTGKTIGDVGERQQRSKLTNLKTNVQKALWFSETFGLQLKDVNFINGNGMEQKLEFKEDRRKSYKELTDDEQKNIKSLLFVLDKFCIGDAAYHELTMVCKNSGLPRSYLIKQCKEELNKMVHIVRTPGRAEGAQVDFSKELESVVLEMVSNFRIDYFISCKFFYYLYNTLLGLQIEQGKIDVNKTGFELQVNISGDGARMSRLISFSILNNEENVMSSKGAYIDGLMC